MKRGRERGRVYGVSPKDSLSFVRKVLSLMSSTNKKEVVDNWKESTKTDMWSQESAESPTTFKHQSSWTKQRKKKRATVVTTCDDEKEGENKESVRIVIVVTYFTFVFYLEAFLK